MCVRVVLHSGIKGVENQGIVIAVANYIGYDPTVIQIKNGTEIDFTLYQFPIHWLKPLELGNISQPLFVRFGCMKFAVEEILCNVLRICCIPCTAMIGMRSSTVTLLLDITTLPS